MLTDSLGAMRLQNGEAIARTLQSAATAIQAAVPAAPPKSRAERLSIAVKALEEANSGFGAAFQAKRRPGPRSRRRLQRC